MVRDAPERVSGQIIIDSAVLSAALSRLRAEVLGLAREGDHRSAPLLEELERRVADAHAGPLSFPTAFDRQATTELLTEIRAALSEDRHLRSANVTRS